MFILFYTILMSCVQKQTIIKLFSEKMNINNKQNLNVYKTLFDDVEISNIKMKFTLFNYLLNNNFILEKDKNELLEIFYKSQFIYRKLNNFVYRYKLKKSNHYEYIDCGFDSLDNCQDKFKFTLLCNGIKYTFKKSDIINIIKKSILCCPDMFVEPLDIKNPWTNLPFDTANLYNIYFYLKQTDSIPFVYELYFKCNFNKTNLVSNYEPIILDEYLKQYINDITFEQKFRLIRELIIKYKSCNKTLRDFKLLNHKYCREKVVTVFTPILKKYLIIKYTINDSLKFNYERELIKDLTILADSKIDFKPKPKERKRKYTPQQIVFESLQKINIFSFNKKKETIIPSSKSLFIFTGDSSDYKFSVPNIKTKVSDDFVKLNKINMTNANIQRLRMQKTQYLISIAQQHQQIRNVRARTPSIETTTTNDLSRNSLEIVGTRVITPNYQVDRNNVVNTISDMIENINWESEIINAFRNQNISNVEVNLTDIVSNYGTNDSSNDSTNQGEEDSFDDSVYDNYVNNRYDEDEEDELNDGYDSL